MYGSRFSFTYSFKVSALGYNISVFYLFVLCFGCDSCFFFFIIISVCVIFLLLLILIS